MNVAPNAESGKEKRKCKFPCRVCGGDHLTHQCPHMDEVHNFLASRGGTSQTTAVLTNPFPHQQQQLVAVAAPPPGGSAAPPPPPQGGNMAPPLQGGNGSTTNIYMCESEILLQTRAHNYDPKGKSSAETASSVPPPETSLHIERPIVDPIPRPPKGSVR